MSVEGFLAVVFAAAAAFGAGLHWWGWHRTFWIMVLALAASLAVSVIGLWRPQTDDPYPALMLLVIGVYGSGAALLGLVCGMVLMRMIVRGRDGA